jgi:hypothetical protein
VCSLDLDDGLVSPFRLALFILRIPNSPTITLSFHFSSARSLSDIWASGGLVGLQGLCWASGEIRKTILRASVLLHLST